MEAKVPAPPKFLQEKIGSLLTESRDVSMDNLRDDVVTLYYPDIKNKTIMARYAGIIKEIDF